jgi:hypothetical protein
VQNKSQQNISLVRNSSSLRVNSEKHLNKDLNFRQSRETSKHYALSNSIEEDEVENDSYDDYSNHRERLISQPKGNPNNHFVSPAANLHKSSSISHTMPKNVRKSS